MPITVLDPVTALIVIDLQKGVLATPKAHPAADIVQRAVALAQAFRQHRLPVVWVNVNGFPPGRAEQGVRGTPPPEWSELAPELQPQAGDHRVTKQSWGAFTGTGLDAYLKEQGATQIVLAGISTSIGVETTARQAYELGLNVALAIDAMTDTHADAHQNSITRIFPRLGETGSTQDVIAHLAGHNRA